MIYAKLQHSIQSMLEGALEIVHPSSDVFDGRASMDSLYGWNTIPNYPRVEVLPAPNDSHSLTGSTRHLLVANADGSNIARAVGKAEVTGVQGKSGLYITHPCSILPR